MEGSSRAMLPLLGALVRCLSMARQSSAYSLIAVIKSTADSIRYDATILHRLIRHYVA